MVLRAVIAVVVAVLVAAPSGAVFVTRVAASSLILFPKGTAVLAGFDVAERYALCPLFVCGHGEVVSV